MTDPQLAALLHHIHARLVASIGGEVPPSVNLRLATASDQELDATLRIAMTGREVAGLHQLRLDLHTQITALLKPKG